VVGDEKTETLKEKVKGWIELGGDSSLAYHKKQTLLDNKVNTALALCCGLVPLCYGCIVVKRCEIGPRLLLITGRKLHTPF